VVGRPEGDGEEPDRLREVGQRADRFGVRDVGGRVMSTWSVAACGLPASSSWLCDGERVRSRRGRLGRWADGLAAGGGPCDVWRHGVDDVVARDFVPGCMDLFRSPNRGRCPAGGATADPWMSWSAGDAGVAERVSAGLRPDTQTVRFRADGNKQHFSNS
jgi:hypothetical protein